MKAGERARESGKGIADDGIAKCRVTVGVLIGVDHEAVHLRRQSLDHVLHHWLAVELDQALVDAAHAAALTAREHDAGNALHAGGTSSCVQGIHRTCPSMNA